MPTSMRFKWPGSVPRDQVDHSFIQGMLDRMAVGFHNYGHMLRKHDRPQNIENIKLRLKKYQQTGNTEFLMDAANYCMMEFAVPSHKRAHFRPTSSDESPGSVVVGRVIKNKSELKPAHFVRQSKEGD